MRDGQDHRARSRPRVGRLLLLLTVITVVATGLLQVLRVHPPRLAPLPSTQVIGPGIGIDVISADGSGTVSCTAGFLVRTRDGRPGLLSAGHCNRPGGPGRVAIHHGGLYRYPTVGTFAESVYGGNTWEDYDIGLIDLDRVGKIPLVAEVDGHPVTGLAERVEVGDRLCHFGIRSGEAICGPVVAGDANKVRFAASGTCGDSGGPVYAVRDDGTAEAVGIYTAVSGGDSSEPHCEDPHEFSVAQMIAPWLNAWELTLVTAREPV